MALNQSKSWGIQSVFGSNEMAGSPSPLTYGFFYQNCREERFTSSVVINHNDWLDIPFDENAELSFYFGDGITMINDASISEEPTPIMPATPSSEFYNFVRLLIFCNNKKLMQNVDASVGIYKGRTSESSYENVNKHPSLRNPERIHPINSSEQRQFDWSEYGNATTEIIQPFFFEKRDGFESYYNKIQVNEDKWKEFNSRDNWYWGIKLESRAGATETNWNLLLTKGTVFTINAQFGTNLLGWGNKTDTPYLTLED